MLLKTVLLILFAALLSFAQTTPPAEAANDRNCGNDLSNLWLDVVVVVDNSVGMTQNGLVEVGF